MNVLDSKFFKSGPTSVTSRNQGQRINASLDSKLMFYERSHNRNIYERRSDLPGIQLIKAVAPSPLLFILSMWEIRKR